MAWHQKLSGQLKDAQRGEQTLTTGISLGLSDELL